MGTSRTQNIILRVEQRAETAVARALSGMKIAGQLIATATLSVSRKKSVKVQPKSKG